MSDDYNHDISIVKRVYTAFMFTLDKLKWISVISVIFPYFINSWKEKKKHPKKSKPLTEKCKHAKGVEKNLDYMIKVVQGTFCEFILFLFSVTVNISSGMCCLKLF